MRSERGVAPVETGREDRHDPSLVSTSAALAAVVVLGAAGGTAAAARRPAQGTQPDAQFAASFVSSGTTAVDATTQKVSCYRPEVAYFDGAAQMRDTRTAAARCARGRHDGASRWGRTRRKTAGARRMPMLSQRSLGVRHSRRPDERAT